MQQDSDTPANPDIDGVARRVLDSAKDEPIPVKIIELSEELESALEAARKRAPKGKL